MWGYGLDRAGSGQGQVAGICECGNEPSGSIKCGEFLDQLQTGKLLKKDSAPWGQYVSIRSYISVSLLIFTGVKTTLLINNADCGQFGLGGYQKFYMTDSMGEYS